MCESLGNGRFRLQLVIGGPQGVASVWWWWWWGGGVRPVCVCVGGGGLYIVAYIFI